MPKSNENIAFFAFIDDEKTQIECEEDFSQISDESAEKMQITGADEDFQENYFAKVKYYLQGGRALLEYNMEEVMEEEEEVGEVEKEFPFIPSDNLLDEKCGSCLELCREPLLPQFKLLLQVDAF